MFMRLWLHRSEAGMNLSPLILGRVTQWKPHRRGGSDLTRTGLTQRLSWMTMPIVLLAAALLAAGIAFGVYRSSRWSSAQITAAGKPPSVLPPFDTMHVHGNVHESLRKFADQQSARGESTERGSVD